MTYGEIFSGAVACCVILWGGIRAWSHVDVGWNRRRAILRFSLAAVNVGLLLAGAVSRRIPVIVGFYAALISSALVILLQEWHCRRNNM